MPPDGGSASVASKMSSRLVTCFSCNSGNRCYGFIRTDFLRLLLTMGLIFISHSSNDLEIAEQFVDSLKALGVKDEDIFFSAKTHLGVGVGNRFPEVINEKFHQSTLVFLLLTKNYYASYNCQQEEGAAWYTMKEKRIYPIRIGVSLDEMKGFIDKTVIASLPETNNLRDIPYVLEE